VKVQLHPFLKLEVSDSFSEEPIYPAEHNQGYPFVGLRVFQDFGQEKSLFRLPEMGDVSYKMSLI